MARLLVVGALVRAPDGTILVTQRLPGAHLEGRWEFPGGKVEVGEAPPSALVREIKEELGVVARVGDIFAVGHHQYDTREVVLMVYEVEIVSGTPRCVEVADIKWVTVEALEGLNLPPADAPVLARLKRETSAT